MKHKRFFWQSAGLLLLVVLAIGLFMTYKTYGNWTFALEYRGKKLLAFVLAAAAAAFGTITFQTLTHNRFLTPGILGIDQLYVVIQTLLFFLLGGATAAAKETLPQFLGNVFLMALLSVAFILFFLGNSGNDFFRLLMVGMVASSLFGSISTFLQVLMDPNEYDLLQGKLFASFGNVSADHLIASTLLLGLICGGLWWFAPELDVMHLGYDHGTNLGLSVPQLQRLLLFLMAAATGVATALVGPTVFLGFIIATISYQVFAVYDHRRLFFGTTLIGILFLVMGQFVVEQLFALRVTISTVIQFIGGVFFVGKIIIERKRV